MRRTPCGRVWGWWHRRLRRLDRETLLPTLRTRAELTATGTYDRLSTEWLHAVDERTNTAWALHKTLPGQEHWRCACAGAE